MSPSFLALLHVALLAASLSMLHVKASDPDPLQDFCVPDDGDEPYSQEITPGMENSYPGNNPASMGSATEKANGSQELLINGGSAACKNSANVTADDFLFRGLRLAGMTANKIGSAVTLANAKNFLALNTLSLSIARIDFNVKGINPPHIHPRATEVLTVLEGTLNVGFILTNNTLYSQTLQKGDLFIFPRGLLHFQQNTGPGKAVALATLNSQNPGLQVAATALLGEQPPLKEEVLEKAFQVEEEELQHLRAVFGASHH